MSFSKMQKKSSILCCDKAKRIWFGKLKIELFFCIFEKDIKYQIIWTE